MRSVLVLLAITVCAWAQAQRDLRYESGAGKKLALLIGNDAYPKWPLRNPVNDARSVEQALRELGFQTETVLNTGLKKLEQSVDQFVSRIQPGDVALFYYAGHGIQIDTQNYLVPVDFDAKDEADAKYVSYSASRLQERIDRAGARLSIMVLDACRNNPFRATRSTGGGLAAMNTGKGTLIAFATSPGKTADDNVNGTNGLFTSHLVRSLREPGLSLDQVFNRVRERVYAESGERQLPWTVSSVIGEFYFRPGAQKGESSLLRTVRQSLADPPPAPVSRAPEPIAAPAAPGKDQLLADAVALYNQQQFDAFEPAALAAIEAGAELQFLLGHHHTLTGIHASALKVTATSIAYDHLGNTNVCNQKPLSVARTAMVSAQQIRSDRGEIFFNLKVRDEQNKVRNFNFADADSRVDTTQGLPLVVSPVKAQRAMQAIANVLTRTAQR